MPSKPLRSCRAAGCPKPAVIGGRCREHARELRREYDKDRPSAAQRGYDRKWRRIRAQFLRHHPYCSECGAPATDVDHIVPLRKGGTNEWANLQSFCHRHHSAKTMRESVRAGGSQSLGENA